MLKCMIALAAILVTAGCIASAQADRNYLTGGVAYLSAGGGLVDSARLRSSMGYSVGYQWAPTRNWSFGVNGWFIPTEVAPFPAEGVIELVSYSAATVFSMSAVATFRVLKHGFTPYVSAEAGFGYLTVADALMQNANLNPKLGTMFSGSAGFLIPLSNHIDLDATARYSTMGFGIGLQHLGAMIGARYRLR